MHARLHRRSGRLTPVASLLLVALAAAFVPGGRAGAAAARGIVIALNSDINTLDPHMTATVPTDLSVISHLYSSLIIRAPDLKLHPAAAASWKATGDTAWRFALRDGITFPNGEKLDAQAVKWNFDRVMDPATKARIRPWFDLVKQVTIVDARTLDVVTKEPYPALPDQLSLFFLLPPAWAAKTNPAAQAMGTGPYRLKEWVRDDHITLEAAPRTGDPAAPFPTVSFRVIPELSSRVAALLAGDVDVVTNVAPADFGRITRNAATTVGAVPSIRTAFVKFNALKKPFDDPRVRQALNYAVDKDALVKNLFANLTSKSACQVLTPAYFGFNESLKPYPHDPRKARELLAAAGYPNGFETEFDVPTGVYLLGDEISQAITEQIAQVGVRARINEMPFSVYMDKYLKQNNLAPMAYITQAWATIDADGLLSLFEQGNQYAYWNDGPFKNLLMSARTTVNRERRLAVYRQATERMCEQAPVLFLFPQPATFGVRKTIDWKARADDWVRVMDMRPK